MPGPFDTTTKYLVQAYPADWMAFLGFRTSDPIEVIDASLSAVSAEVDKLVRIRSVEPWLVHLEFQSSYDPTVGARLARYNTMVYLDRERLPVASVLVLLRPVADGPATSGTHRVAIPGSQPYLSFSFAVRRIWREPARDFLDGALGTLPLAPLGATGRTALPGMIRAMEQRFDREAPGAEAARLRVVTYTLLGLRYTPDVAEQLMPGIRNMRDSSTYQAILDEGRAEGRAEGERRSILLIGTARLGAPDDAIRARIDAITDADVLERLVTRSLTVSSWAELLDAQE